ncbi:hypothetical protein GCM10027093_21340 [Paraburkholderia jirisanensis]
MSKRPKRVLSVEYREGSRRALELLREEESHGTDAWVFAERFLCQFREMDRESGRGFRDAMFLFIQCTIQGAPANLDEEGNSWLADLEDPDRWMEDEHD